MLASLNSVNWFALESAGSSAQPRLHRALVGQRAAEGSDYAQSSKAAAPYSESEIHETGLAVLLRTVTDLLIRDRVSDPI